MDVPCSSSVSVALDDCSFLARFGGIGVVFAVFMGRFFVWKKRMEVNLFMKYIRDIYSVQLIQLLADCAEDN